MVRIEPTLPTPANIARPLGPNALLPIGRVLDAVVIQQRAGQLYELNAGPLRLLAESQQQLRPGEQLTLRVTGRDTSQRPTLEVLPRQTTATTPFLKTVLPQQQEPTRLLATLWQLSQAKPEHPVLQRAAQLIEQLPARQQLTEPNNLQRVLLNSGLFMEHQLQSGQPVAASDLKVALMKLLRALGGQQARATGSPGAKTAETASQSQPQPAPNPAASTAKAGAQQASPQAGTPSQPSQAPASGSERVPAGTYTRPTTAPPTASSASGPHQGGQPTTAGQSTLNNPQTAAVVPTREALPGQVRPLPRAEPPPVADIANIAKFIGQLAKTTESTLARLEAHQLLHLQSQDTNSPQWLLELPVRDKDGIDVWQLHIAREDQQKATDEEQLERTWHITLSFDFPNTGPVITRVEHSSEKTAINFYSELADTDALIAQQVESFRQLLEEKGIDGVMVSHHQGLPHKDILPSALHSVLEDQA